MEMSSLYSLVRSAMSEDVAGQPLVDEYVAQHARDKGVSERHVWDGLRVEARRRGDDVVEVLAARKLRRSLLGGFQKPAAAFIRRQTA